MDVVRKTKTELSIHYIRFQLSTSPQWSTHLTSVSEVHVQTEQWDSGSYAFVALYFPQNQ
jgi:hypothetical protein